MIAYQRINPSLDRVDSASNLVVDCILPKKLLRRLRRGLFWLIVVQRVSCVEGFLPAMQLPLQCGTRPMVYRRCLPGMTSTLLTFHESRRVSFLAAQLRAAFSPNVVSGTDVTPQPDASSAAVLEPRALFTIHGMQISW